MGRFINHQAASDYLKSIDDPIVQGLVRYSYQTACLTGPEPEGTFDLLFFFRVMHTFLRDREKLAKNLLGEYGEDLTGWGT